MGKYPTEFETQVGDNGTWPGAATKKGNSLGPKFGNYSSEIQYKGDGRQATDPGPQQNFRKELPAPQKSGRIGDGQYYHDASVEPGFGPWTGGGKSLTDGAGAYSKNDMSVLGRPGKPGKP